MAPKKTISSRVQSPSFAQRALLADQKRQDKASWKKSAMGNRQRQLVVILLKFSRAVQAAMCIYESTNTDEDEDLEQSLKSAVDNAVLLYQQQKQFFAAGVKKGKQLRALQLAFEKVDFQMRMVYREYASNVETLKQIEARIASYKTLDPVPAEDLVAVERRQQDTSTIIAFKTRA